MSAVWDQVNVESDPEGPLNPHGVGFSAHETELRSELAARRRVDPSASRMWKIKNHNSRNTVTGMLCRMPKFYAFFRLFHMVLTDMTGRPGCCCCCLLPLRPKAQNAWLIPGGAAGVPVSYKLVPAPSPPLYALPSSSHARRGIFATRNLWVTPHSEDENYPAGFHPLQTHGADGLEQWTSMVRPLALPQCRWLCAC